MEKQYKAVFFDLGGTLRIAFLEEAYMRHARRKMAEIAGTDMPYEEFYQMIEERYEPYRKWALGEFKESGDEELWCKWLLPDYDPARIRQVCHELSFQYRQCKGRREVVDGGVEVIKGLHERGYKLGIISNLIGENEVPDWLEEEYLDQQGGTISPDQSSFTVPEGCLFFLGDNRSGSNDARYWEESYIPVGNVKARVLLAISLTGGSSWQGVRAIG